MVFKCQDCNYSTELKFNFQKHLNTNKHFLNSQKCGKKYENVEKSMNLIEINTKKIKNEKKFVCEWCTRCFCRMDSLNRHESRCKNKKNIFFEKKYENNTTNFKKVVLPKNVYDKSETKINTNTNKGDDAKSSKIVEKNVEKSMKKRKINREKSCTTNHNKFTTNFEEVNFKCQYCNNIYQHQRSLNRHLFYCSVKDSQINSIQKQKNLEIQNIIQQQELEKEKIKNDFNQQLLNEKEIRLAEKDKTIEIAHQSKVINITQTSNKTINFLNTHFGGMIVMEQFLTNLEQTEKLTLQERQNLLESYQEGGIDLFARNFSYVMKQNCKRQLENQGIEDMKLLPLFCSDGNLRSHKEKQDNGWKTLYDNQSINRMLNISNDQIHESYQQVVPITGKERTRIYKEIKKDNHQNKFLSIENKNNE